MAHDAPVQAGGTRTLLVESNDGNKETRAVQAEVVGTERRVITSAHVKPLTGSIKSSSVSVGTTATKLPTTPLSSRVVLCIKNDEDAKVVYIGASDVTTSNGFPLYGESVAGKSDGGEIVLDVDDTIDVYGIVATGTADVRLLELS